MKQDPLTVGKQISAFYIFKKEKISQTYFLKK
jgi:hypothetical protein